MTATSNYELYYHYQTVCQTPSNTERIQTKRCPKAEASGEAGLSALEVLGALLSLVVSGAVIAALAGVTGSVTAYVTRRCGLA